MIERAMDAAISQYAEAYQKLYRSLPKGLQAVSWDQVQINGEIIPLLELEYRTSQLQEQYAAKLAERKEMVERLVEMLRYSD